MARKRTAPVERFVIEPGTLLVLCDVDLDDDTHERLVETLADVAGHKQFVVLRVSSSNPVTKYGVNDVLAIINPNRQKGNTDGNES